jgi:chemotaxis family two-component system sensor kinase Cph1
LTACSHFAQLGNHALLLTDVDLGALVQRTQAALEPELEGRNVQWEIGPLPTVRADQSLMTQVISNLLGNAVKYSARSNPAVIQVFADASVPGEHRICVADNGIGIDMRHASRLFRVFSRLHHADEFDGTGIGLATGAPHPGAPRRARLGGKRAWSRARASGLPCLPDWGNLPA